MTMTELQSIPRFSIAYEQGTVVDERGYHRPHGAGRESSNCGCELTTPKGAYRDVTIDLPDGRRVFFYHQTPVVVVDAARRSYRLTSGGYRTSTTKERLNRHTPRAVRVYQRDYDWFVQVGDDVIDFEDGMTVEAA